MWDVSENILPFESQSINNFSCYDISQSVDWECPSLSLHVLLIWPKLALFGRPERQMENDEGHSPVLRERSLETRTFVAYEARGSGPTSS